MAGYCLVPNLFDRCSIFDVTHNKETDQRETYDCVESRDISVSDTCIPRCKYCYATSNFDKALNNYQEHDKEVPSLISSIEKEHFHSDGFRCSGK